MKEYHVIETPMFPNKWKVEQIKWPGHDNSTCNYFADKQKALNEAHRRNNKN
jgi:hypothetical protein